MPSKLAGNVLFLLVLSLLAVSPARAQDTAVAEFPVDTLLRSSCYCINCSTSHIDELAGARCKFVRWARYPWVNPLDTGVNQNYQLEHNREFAHLANLTTAFKRDVHAKGVTEFVLPEIVTAGVETVVIEPHLIAPLASLQLVPNLTASYRFVFAEVRYPRTNADPDHYWNRDPQSERNGVPSLVSPAGRLWAAYLAARAFESGADAIGFGQAQLRVNTAADLDFMARKIRLLRATMHPQRRRLVVGATSTWAIPQSSPAVDLKLSVDYTKFWVDIDAYRMVNGIRQIPNPAGGWLPCQLLGSTLDATLLPTSAAALQQQHLCMLSVTRPQRPYIEGRPSEPSFNNSNPYGLNVLLELDGYQPCVDKANPARRIMFYEPDPPFETTCHQSVRHGLSTVMFLLSRSQQARQAFHRYMYNLALSLSTSTRGVYFPLMINVDQNRMHQVLERKNCAFACTPECLNAEYARPSQVNLIPGCPTIENPQGIYCAAAGRTYQAAVCEPDFKTVSSLLPP